MLFPVYPGWAFVVPILAMTAAPVGATSMERNLSRGIVHMHLFYGDLSRILSKRLLAPSRHRGCLQCRERNRIYQLQGNFGKALIPNPDPPEAEN